MYVELSAFKEYLGITTNDDDALLYRLLGRAQTIFEGRTRHTFEAASDSTRYFDALLNTAGPILMLDAPLCAITTITNGDGSVIASDKYVTEPRNDTPYYAIRLRSSSGISWKSSASGDSENAIAITGRWAYSATAPDDVVDAVIDIATVLYRKKDNANDYGRTVVTQTSTILPGGVSATTIGTINRYRRLI